MKLPTKRTAPIATTTADLDELLADHDLLARADDLRNGRSRLRVLSDDLLSARGRARLARSTADATDPRDADRWLARRDAANAADADVERLSGELETLARQVTEDDEDFKRLSREHRDRAYPVALEAWRTNCAELAAALDTVRPILERAEEVRHVVDRYADAYGWTGGRFVRPVPRLFALFAISGTDGEDLASRWLSEATAAGWL